MFVDHSNFFNCFCNIIWEHEEITCHVITTVNTRLNRKKISFCRGAPKVAALAGPI
jgi:hypothetical protein